MVNDVKLTEAEEIATIRKTLDEHNGGTIGGWNSIMARVPINKRRIMSLCRKHAEEWGYTYHKAEYVSSGSGAFGRLSSKRGSYRHPAMIPKRST